ncbi:MAG TPA: 4-alpha-glucanotransferase [Bryobacteraceae bacterium]|nr:4-alpha-glucanotransferase [Bryobacteraceae bacterium]
MTQEIESFEPHFDYARALEAALTAFGIDSKFYDIWGKLHILSTEAAQAILRSLNIPCHTTDDLNQALFHRHQSKWSTLLQPTIITDANAPDVPVSIPKHWADATLYATLTLENGQELSSSATISALPLTGTGMVGNEVFERRLITPLPPLADTGYHQISIAIKRDEQTLAEASARLVLCPESAYSTDDLPNEGRCAGIAVSLYGLRSARNWGCGDFADLHGLIDWARRDLGAAFVSLNPLHAIANRTPYNTSPYLPLSSFYRNPLYLDIERVPEFQASDCAQRLFHSPKVQNEIAALRDSKYVEYERSWRLKRVFLKQLFRTFLQREWRHHTPRAQEFEQYVAAEGPLLHRYALFCALDEVMHRQNRDVWIWRDWPAGYHHPETVESQEFARTHWRSVMLHKYIQWLVDTQVAAAQRHALDAGTPIGLYHDLALATDRWGSDLWAYPEFYVEGCRVGSPPDSFSPKGQDWAFPPPKTSRHQEDSYRLFVESIRHNIRHGGALRIDHVMRFFRLYWIPEGFDATQGTYVRDRADELIRLLALESQRNKVVIVGEDLGTVEPYIRESLHKFGILSYRLLYFERTPDGGFKDPSVYPEQSLVSVSTHDLPTLAGFWEGRDIEVRRAASLFPSDDVYRAEWEQRLIDKQHMLDIFLRLDLLPSWYPRLARDIPVFTGELHNAAIGFLALAKSKLMCVNQEDITKATDQQNLPGTTDQYPNWRHKMEFTLEELNSGDRTRDFTQMVRGWVESSERLV